jgi:hypothetical protein
VGIFPNVRAAIRLVGAVVLSIEGEESRVDRAFELLKSIKGEPPVTAPQALFVESPAVFDYEWPFHSSRRSSCTP